VPSARAIHQAARLSLEARFSTEWCSRAPYRSLHQRFLAAVEPLTAWPEPEAYDELAAQVPRRSSTASLPRFITQDRDAVERLGGYEPHVAQTRTVPTRPRSWHDFFNMAIWAHFPATRWALNALHVDGSLGPVDPRNGRAPQQNVAAQFDESGIIVASSAPGLLAELRALRFKHVFWERRDELLATTRFWIVGHGMLESLLTPHPALAGKALLLELPQTPSAHPSDELRESLDARVAEQVLSWRTGAPLLDPLPLLGVPGFADNAASEFYDNERYFRFQRRPRSPR
jgi:hypothetical protein